MVPLRGSIRASIKGTIGLYKGLGFSVEGA